MEKFGVFELLNSLLSIYENAKHPNTKPDNADIAANVKENVAPKQAKPAVPTAQSKASATPLQASMLGVMNSHDAFIRRVREKNKP